LVVSPVSIERDPDDLDSVDPVRRAILPLELSSPEPAIAVEISISPDSIVELFPLVTTIEPPTVFLESPPEIAISAPEPMLLSPTLSVMGPALPLFESPLET
jgi:hypothetical protein